MNTREFPDKEAADRTTEASEPRADDSATHSIRNGAAILVLSYLKRFEKPPQKS